MARAKGGGKTFEELVISGVGQLRHDTLGKMLITFILVLCIWTFIVHWSLVLPVIWRADPLAAALSTSLHHLLHGSYPVFCPVIGALVLVRCDCYATLCCLLLCRFVLLVYLPRTSICMPIDLKESSTKVSSRQMVWVCTCGGVCVYGDGNAFVVHTHTHYHLHTHVYVYGDGNAFVVVYMCMEMVMGMGMDYCLHLASSLLVTCVLRMLVTHFIRFLIYSLYRAVTTNPGFVPPPSVVQKQGSRGQAAAGYCDNWCLKCAHTRPPRAHHCKVCNRCVKKMDHVSCPPCAPVKPCLALVLPSPSHRRAQPADGCDGTRTCSTQQDRHRQDKR